MAKRRPSGDGMVRKREDGRWEGRIVVGHKKNGTPIFQHAYAHTQKELTEKLHQNIEYYTITTEETALQVAERTPFEAKWRLLARVGVRCYILISNVSGAVKVAPLQILQFPVVLPHKFQDTE